MANQALCTVAPACTWMVPFPCRCSGCKAPYSSSTFPGRLRLRGHSTGGSHCQVYSLPDVCSLPSPPVGRSSWATCSVRPTQEVLLPVTVLYSSLACHIACTPRPLTCWSTNSIGQDCVFVYCHLERSPLLIDISINPDGINERTVEVINTMCLVSAPK